MSDNADLISVKEAQGRLEFSRPQQVHQLLKKCPDARVKDGKRTFIDWPVLEAWVKANPEHGVGQGPTKRTKRVADFKTEEQLDEERQINRARGYPEPFEANPLYLLWNKGIYRGWSFGACESVNEELAVFITQAGKTHHWVSTRIAADISSGDMFVLDPTEAIRFFVLQLLRVKEDDARIKEAIKHLNSAAAVLDEVKAEQPDDA